MEWRQIEGFPEYEVSSEGQIRSRDRIVKCNRGMRLAKGRVLVPHKLKTTGYLQVAPRGQKRSVHRLVATAFLGPQPSRMVVNHKNGIRTDNRIENLEWCTNSENVRHGFRVLHPEVRPFLGKFSAEHPTSKALVSVDMKTGCVTRYESAMDAVREGFDSSCISRCCHGKNKWHKGRAWHFVDMVDRIAAQAGVFIPMQVAA